MPLKKSSLSVSTNLMYIHVLFQIYGHYGVGGVQVVNAQKLCFYFESVIAKVFLFRYTCSSYDSERKKSQKVSRKESEQMWQTWINSMRGI